MEIKLTPHDITDLRQGLIILIKHLDQFKKGSDKLLADRLEIIKDKLEG